MTPEQIAADRAVIEAVPAKLYKLMVDCGRLEIWDGSFAIAGVGDPAVAMLFITARTRWPAALDALEQAQRERAEYRNCFHDKIIECDALQAETRRLRGALETIFDTCADHDCNRCGVAAGNAWRALEVKPNG